MLKFIRPRSAYAALGLSESQFRRQVAEGLIPPPVKIGERADAYLEEEINAIQAALAIATSKDGRKDLVRKLVESRPARYRHPLLGEQAA